MALDPLDIWVERLLQMQPKDTKLQGAWNLANWYGDLADKVEATGGSVGIFTFNRPLFVSTLAPGFNPDPSAPSWAARLASAWEIACKDSKITPATVPNGAWTQSAVDVLTAPKGAATIITLSQAKNLLENKLIASATAFAGDPDAGHKAFAKAFRDATLAFIFLTIGIAILNTPVPIPLPAT